MGKSIEKNKSVPEEPREESTKVKYFLPYEQTVVEAENLEEVSELTKKEEDGDANK